VRFDFIDVDTRAGVISHAVFHNRTFDSHLFAADDHTTMRANDAPQPFWLCSYSRISR
jgi:hypothetical protein